MIHLVHFWLKEEYQTEEVRNKFEAALEKLCQIPLAMQSSWGVPAKVMKRPVLDLSWDYNLITEFETIEAHDEYQVDPVHVKFLDENKHYWEKVLVMDSEIIFSAPKRD